MAASIPRRPGFHSLLGVVRHPSLFPLSDLPGLVPVCVYPSSTTAKRALLFACPSSLLSTSGSSAHPVPPGRPKTNHDHCYWQPTSPYSTPTLLAPTLRSMLALRTARLCSWELGFCFFSALPTRTPNKAICRRLSSLLNWK